MGHVSIQQRTQLTGMYCIVKRTLVSEELIPSRFQSRHFGNLKCYRNKHFSGKYLVGKARNFNFILRRDIM